MLHGHLPILISRLGAVMRHATDLYHSATRMIELGFYSIQTRRRPDDLRMRRALPTQRHRARRSRPLLVHYHIFKNAGSSFEWTLKEAFGDAFHSYDSASPGGILAR